MRSTPIPPWDRDLPERASALFRHERPQGLRDDLGVMSPVGDAVQLPLQRGRNELVVAVPGYSGGWAFWPGLDAVGHDEFPGD